ncbi:hypothetical protein X793_04890 [Dehalococcoides mccartyi CG4]|nr:hypothetical protein X793_04890 [Dehalococcoides mccartyi CG4]
MLTQRVNGLGSRKPNGVIQVGLAAGEALTYPKAYRVRPKCLLKMAGSFRVTAN